MIRFLDTGKVLADFGARLRSREVAVASLNVQHVWPMSAYTPYISDRFKSYWKRMVLTIELKGTWAQIESNKADLVHQLSNGRLSFFDELDKAYLYVLDGAPSMSDQYDGQFETLTITLKTAKEDAYEATEDLTDGQSLTLTYVDTVLPLRTVFELTGTGTATITLNGQTITADELTGAVRIIGDGRITEGGVNMWEHTQLPGGAFPELLPGDNTLSVSGTSLRVRTKRRYL